MKLKDFLDLCQNDVYISLKREFFANPMKGWSDDNEFLDYIDPYMDNTVTGFEITENGFGIAIYIKGDK